MTDTHNTQKQEITTKIAEITSLAQSLEETLKNTEDLDLWYFLATALFKLGCGPVDFEGVFDNMTPAQTEYYYSQTFRKDLEGDWLARDEELKDNQHG